MNKYYSIFSIFLLLFFVGCGTKTSIDYFDENIESAYAIQYTKKSDIVQGTEVKAMIIATYLNKISPKYQSKNFNSFIIGFHDVNKDTSDLTGNDYKLTLNDKEPVTLKKLTHDLDFLDNVSLKNKWATYYVADFEKDEDKKLNLKLSHEEWGSALIEFQE